MAKGIVYIDVDRCKGCNLCATACLPQLLHLDSRQLNAHGYHPAVLDDPAGRCSGCALCAVICPDVCLTVYRFVAPLAVRLN